MWSSPIRQKKVKPEKPEQETWVKPKAMAKSEVKKFLNPTKPLTASDIDWCHRWLSQFVRERSLPPQIVGEDGYGVLMKFLSPQDASEALLKIRRDFLSVSHQNPEPLHIDPLLSLPPLPPGSYHEHLPPPLPSTRNSQK